MKKTLQLLLLSLFWFSALGQTPAYDFGKYSTHTNNSNNSYTAVDAQSNFYVASSYTGTINIEPGNSIFNRTSNGGDDFYVAKYNSNGTIQWVRSLGDSGFETVSGMEVDSNGDIYVTGSFTSIRFEVVSGLSLFAPNNGGNSFLIKINGSTGGVIWAKAFEDTRPSNTAYTYNLDVDKNNDIVLVGFFQGNFDFDPSTGTSPSSPSGNTDIFVAKFNSAGNFLWVKNFGTVDYEEVQYVNCDSDNNIIISGLLSNVNLDFAPNVSGGLVTTDPPSGGTKPFLVKLNSQGSFIWGGMFAGSSIRGITTGADGSVYCTGIFQLNATVDFDISSSGVSNLTSVSYSDIFVLKLSSAGGLTWVKQLGSPFNYHDARGIALDVYNNVYTVGNFPSTMDFNPGSGIANLTPVGSYDAYILKLNGSGDYVWAGSWGGTLSDLGRDINIDGRGKVYILGKMSGTGDINPTSGTDNRTGAGTSFVRLSNFTSTNPTTNNTAVTASTLNDNGGTPIIFQDQSGVISEIQPFGSSPVTGQITAKVWVNTSGYGSYLNRNLEITPQTNPNTATGKVTIYFTQAEFDAYNATSTTDLPSNPTDAVGKSNLKIDKYSGTSSDNSGNPASYGTSPVIIDPDDTDIVWNTSLNRWEVSFQVNGFSGFFIKGFVNPCVTALTITSTTDDISSGTITKEANATTGTITATNKITGTANVTYRAGKSITLDAGFKADNGTVFKTEFGGCN
jgi:hypothetical protein